jgi:hypothetical protein
MKIHTLAFFATGALTVAPAMAQIPNGGFENWTTVDSYQDPDNWITMNSSTAFAGTYSCEEGTPGAVGNAFAKVTSRQLVPDQPASTVPGILISGDATTGTGGFPYTDRPEALNGSWQYGMQDNDAGSILVLFSKWNEDTQTSDPVGSGTADITGSLTSWQTFSIPITYVNEMDPDSAAIVIFSSAGVAVNGSYVWVDNLTFGAAATTGIDEEGPAMGMEMYPSPASDVLHVTADRPVLEVIIMDMTGRTVLRQGVTGQDLTFNVADLHAGRYLVQARMAGGKRLVRSFVKR